MTKVVLKTRISLLSVEFITSWTFFQSWALKNLPNPCWVDAEASARHSAMEAFQALASSAAFVVENALRTSMRLQDSSGRELVRCYPVLTPWGAD